MLQRFIDFINTNNLCKQDDHLLLAVSGGIDSMVMLHLFLAAGYHCAVAHCNFSLRGEESDGDEDFVRKVVTQKGLSFFFRRFDTLRYAKDKNISVQMAARELRYEWFEELCVQHNISLIAVAHNKDDMAETFLLNLSRGTGIRGLTGIKAINGRIIRPLLFADRREIADYASANDIPYREDSSNSINKYKRNKIRLDILPLLKELNPSFMDALADSIAHLKEVEEIYTHAIEQARKKILSYKEGKTYVDIAALQVLHPLRCYLFEIIREYGFSPNQINDILNLLHAPTGKQITGNDYILLKDRKQLIIYPANSEKGKFYIDEHTQDMHYPLKLKIKTPPPPFMIPTDSNIACLDYDKLIFPLILRKWQPGDYFKPLGMQGLKKLSDFFIDRKISRADKENIWLLLSGEKIAWIIGIRIDDRFKITEQTEIAYTIEKYEE